MSFSSTSIFLLILIMCTSLVFPTKRLMFFYRESIILKKITLERLTPFPIIQIRELTVLGQVSHKVRRTHI